MRSFLLFSLRGKLSLQGELMSACTGAQICNYLSHLNFHISHGPEVTHCLLKKKVGVGVRGACQINF